MYLFADFKKAQNSIYKESASGIIRERIPYILVRFLFLR